MEKLVYLYKKYKMKGFTGPKYKGFRGKVKLLLQDFLFHKEYIFVAEPEGWKVYKEKLNSQVTLKILNNYQEILQYKSAFENAYYKGYFDSWKKYFEWGDTLTLALIKDEVVGFGWFQSGDSKHKTYYIPFKDNEYRAYRDGVFPSERGKNVNTTRHILVLEHLFKRGARRVYIDVFEDNIPSIKSLQYAGFKEFGNIEVINVPLINRKYIRWK